MPGSDARRSASSVEASQITYLARQGAPGGWVSSCGLCVVARFMHQHRRPAERAHLPRPGAEHDGMPAGPRDPAEYRRRPPPAAAPCDTQADGHAAHAPDHLAEDLGDPPVEDDHRRRPADRRAQPAHRIGLVRPDACAAARPPAVGRRPPRVPRWRQAEPERGADRRQQHRPDAERAHQRRGHRPGAAIPGPPGQPRGGPGGEQDQPGQDDGHQPPARPRLVRHGEGLPQDRGRAAEDDGQRQRPVQPGAGRCPARSAGPAGSAGAGSRRRSRPAARSRCPRTRSPSTGCPRSTAGSGRPSARPFAGASPRNRSWPRPSVPRTVCRYGRAASQASAGDDRPRCPRPGSQRSGRRARAPRTTRRTRGRRISSSTATVSRTTPPASSPATRSGIASGPVGGCASR